jgi:iron-sulfur cluster assembly protein
MPLPIMSLTEAAAERVREIISGSEKPMAGVRVGIKDAGCAGQSYTLDYVSEPIKGDDHIVDKGVDVFVEPKATLFLLGTVMDFEEDMLKSGFTFKNPNQTGECGCGESVQLKPAVA